MIQQKLQIYESKICIHLCFYHFCLIFVFYIYISLMCKFKDTLLMLKEIYASFSICNQEDIPRSYYAIGIDYYKTNA